MNYKQYKNAAYVTFGGALIFGGLAVKSAFDLPIKVEDEIVKQYNQTESLISFLEHPANYKFIIKTTKEQKFGNDLTYYISTQDLAENNIIKKAKNYSNLQSVNTQIDSLSSVVQKELEQILRDEIVPEYRELSKTPEVQDYKIKHKKTTRNLGIGFFGLAGFYIAAMGLSMRAWSVKNTSK